MGNYTQGMWRTSIGLDMAASAAICLFSTIGYRYPWMVFEGHQIMHQHQGICEGAFAWVLSLRPRIFASHAWQCSRQVHGCSLD